MIYRVSYMVRGEVRGKKHPGLTRDQEEAPQIGERVEMGGDFFEVTEVQELIPPMGDFGFLHATCEWIPEDD
ncbi:MAG: hypothetical protein PVF45_11800 [Anaerolineae bacterium]|jgi:hypothetical protein